VPAIPVRTEKFVRNTTILLREVKGGPAGARNAAYAGLALVCALYIGLIALTASKVPPTSPPPSGPSDRWAGSPAWAPANA
jgi:hypothetical protein